MKGIPRAHAVLRKAHTAGSIANSKPSAYTTQGSSDP